MKVQSTRFLPRVLLAAVGVMLLGGAAWSRVLALVEGVGSPLAGERVPRQIPFRGHLTRDGVAVTGQQPVTFRLEFADAGVAWSETVAVMVMNGNFDVALGDSAANPLPAELFAGPFINLAIEVDGQSLSGRQRLLTVPFAKRADLAWHAEAASTAATATFASGADRSSRHVVSGPTGVTSVGGTYCGSSAQTFTGAVSVGALSGYRAVKSICETTCSSATAHGCFASEVVTSHSIGHAVPAGFVSSPSESIDLRGGQTRYFRDCSGFTSASSSELGMAWNGSSSVGGLSCSDVSNLLCCD